MATKNLEISEKRLREIVIEEFKKSHKTETVAEAVDHAGISAIVTAASKLMAAVDTFKQKASPAAINALTPGLGQLEKILEDMVSTPGSYVAKPKVEPKKVSLRAVKGEGKENSSLVEAGQQRNVGTRVKILDGMKEFVGKTGKIVDLEKDGNITMYRVLLDQPVEIPGIGTVTDDLWAGKYLKAVK